MQIPDNESSVSCTCQLLLALCWTARAHASSQAALLWSDGDFVRVAAPAKLWNCFFFFFFKDELICHRIIWMHLLERVCVCICLCLCTVRPTGCFLSPSYIVLAKCSDRMERCDTGRTRKQEQDWEHKNRKQEEELISRLLHWTHWMDFCLNWNDLWNYKSFGYQSLRLYNRIIRKKWWRINLLVWILHVLVSQQLLPICVWWRSYPQISVCVGVPAGAVTSCSGISWHAVSS